MNTTHLCQVATDVAIRQANSALIQAFQRRDAQQIANHYRLDGRLLLTHTPLLSNRHVIQAFWQGILDTGLYCTERTTLEWQVSTTLGNEIGNFAFRTRNGELADHGTYVALWQWTEECWQISYEVWRSSRIATLLRQ